MGRILGISCVKVLNILYYFYIMFSINDIKQSNGRFMSMFGGTEKFTEGSSGANSNV